jgi:hypothetical protein
MGYRSRSPSTHSFSYLLAFFLSVLESHGPSRHDIDLSVRIYCTYHQQNVTYWSNNILAPPLLL